MIAKLHEYAVRKSHAISINRYRQNNPGQITKDRLREIRNRIPAKKLGDFTLDQAMAGSDRERQFDQATLEHCRSQYALNAPGVTMADAVSAHTFI